MLIKLLLSKNAIVYFEKASDNKIIKVHFLINRRVRLNDKAKLTI